MLSWKCDICGKDTYVNPPMEPAFEDVEVEKKIPYTKTVKGEKVLVYKTGMVVERRPVMTTMHRQNPFTGEIEECAVQKMIFKKDLALLLNLLVGNESFQRDFCVDCYNIHIRPLVEPLFNKMRSISRK